MLLLWMVCSALSCKNPDNGIEPEHKNSYRGQQQQNNHIIKAVHHPGHHTTPEVGICCALRSILRDRNKRIAVRNIIAERCAWVGELLRLGPGDSELILFSQSNSNDRINNDNM